MRDSRRGESGAVETYRCMACGTRWHRFTPDSSVRGRPPLWYTLPDSVLKHVSHSPRARV